MRISVWSHFAHSSWCIKCNIKKNRKSREGDKCDAYIIAHKTFPVTSARVTQNKSFCAYSWIPRGPPMIQLAKKERNRRRTRKCMRRDPITSTRGAATVRTVRKCVCEHIYKRINTHNGHPESNWASVSARCVTSASAEERIHESRYRESLDVDLQDEVGVGEGGGRQGEVSRQPRGYIALPGCPESWPSRLSPANSCTPLRMCNRGLTPRRPPVFFPHSCSRVRLFPVTSELREKLVSLN